MLRIFRQRKKIKSKPISNANVNHQASSIDCTDIEYEVPVIGLFGFCEEVLITLE